ncbi:MAG TPA: arylamine N-acetyltransferase [Steroidobacteraceae bacterium]|nr:arylamine N-acetyltransferase [Steroidobacteraceae bacterium]
MQRPFPLAEYLQRIGIDAPVTADLPTLAAIHAAHVAAIAFEGLDPFLGRPVKLDLASLQEKILSGRRGGYCFEQNTLLKAALEAIGFSVTGLGARVRWMSPPGSPLGPRSHMLLRIDLHGGSYLADVGFGACLLDQPLPLQMDVEHATAMGTFRLTDAAGMIALDAKRPEGWRTAYVFTLEPQFPSDYEAANWYTATSPNAPFVSTLILERIRAGHRHRLINNRWVTEDRDAEIIADRLIGSAEEFGRVLDEIFGISPPASPQEIFRRFAPSP